MIGCIKNPQIMQAYSRLYDKKVILKEIKNNPGYIFYLANSLTKKIESDNIKGFSDTLYALKICHTQGRFLRISSREFRDQINWLETLGKTYEELDIWAKGMKDFVPAQESLKDLVTTTANEKADSIISTVGDQLATLSRAIVSRHNDRNKTASNDEEVVEIWHDSLTSQKALIRLVDVIMLKIKETPVTVQDKNIKYLTALENYSVQKQYEESQRQKEMNKMLPEIEAQKQLFDEIDSKYHLSNKQLRSRFPQIMQVARELSNSLQTNDAISDDVSRNLVGLMQGLFTEYGPDGRFTGDVVEQYLNDADSLRIVSARLAELGSPQSSRLLQLTNLLEEMIDSGIFDRSPVNGTFDDFILAYIMARDRRETGAEQIEESPVLTPVEESTVDPNDGTIDDIDDEVPIEALRQANYEDIAVFPPGSTATELGEIFRNRVGNEDLPRVEWERIKQLVAMREQCEKQKMVTELILTKHSSWQVLPFFVLLVKLPGDEHDIAVIESPVYGNATYTYRESEDRLGWRDLVGFQRQEARELGAHALVHVDSQKLDKHFYKIWHKVLSELTVRSK